MSQNPYAPNYPSDMNQAPPRTSVMAIVSLVSSLLCCIPGLGVLGTLLGVVAMFRIKGSNGRRTGTGLALTGIVVGVIVSIIWVFVIIGGTMFMKEATRYVSAPVTMMSNPDPALVRAALSPTLAPLVTDAEWTRFRSEIEAEIGTIQPVPNNFIDFFRQYNRVGKLMEGQNQDNAVPLPLIGDKGNGILLIHMPRGNRGAQPSQNPGEFFLSMAENISVLLPSGKQVWLIDPLTSPAGTTPPSSPLP